MKNVQFQKSRYLKVLAKSTLLALLLPVAVLVEAAPYEALLEQAKFWMQSGRSDLAEDSLRRILASDADNTEALLQMALIELNRGNAETAKEWGQKLEIAAPDSNQWQTLQNRLRRDALDNSVLARARAFAARGETKKSIELYQTLFKGDAPPEDLALEYYQTLAGIDASWAEARRELERLAKRFPENYAIAAGLAEILTYRSQTRREGAARLEELWNAKQNNKVLKAWRTSLLWLPATSANAALMKAYLDKFPEDRELSEHLASYQKDTGQARADGYAALNKGRLREAKSAFTTALQNDPNDIDAQVGLGLLQLRSGQFRAADRSLSQAMLRAPKSAGKWREARDSARFYAKLEDARKLYKSGNLPKAYQSVQPLSEVGGRLGTDAQLLEAEILLGLNRPEDAELIYRHQLVLNASSVDARSGLVRSLIARKKFSEADREYARLPKPEQQKLAYLRTQRANALREHGLALIRKGQTAAAEVMLRDAMIAAPDDPWIRLELARLYDDKGQSERAVALVEPTPARSSIDDFTVAALIAEKQQRWDDVSALISQIAKSKRQANHEALLERASRNKRIVSLQQILRTGDPIRIEMALDDIYRNPPSTSAEVGRVAAMLQDEGERSLALALVRRDLDQGLKAAATDYLNHVLIFRKTENDDEARRLLGFLERHAAKDEIASKSLIRARKDMLLAEVTDMIEQKQFAQAYDILVAELERAPNDSPILLALADLYKRGAYYDFSRQVYEHVYAQGGENANLALLGLTENALAADDPDSAEDYLQKAAPLTSPQWLILAARTAEAQGDKRQALVFVEQARMAVVGNTEGAQMYRLGENPFRGGRSGLRKQDNSSRWVQLTTHKTSDEFAESSAWLPSRSITGGTWQPDINDQQYIRHAFDEKSAKTVASTENSASPYNDNMPLQWSARYWRDRGQEHINTASINEADVARRREVTNIEEYRSKLKKDLSPRLRGDIAMRFRDGEEGLSELAEISGDLAFSGVPFASGRLEAVINPVFLNAGSVTNDSARRFFRSAVTNAGTQALAEKLNGASQIIDDIDNSAQELAQATASLEAVQNSANPSASEIAAVEARVQTAQRNFSLATSRNPLFESGIDLDTLTVSQRKFVDDFLLENFGDNDFSLVSTDVATYQSRSTAVRNLISQLTTRLGSYNRAIPLGSQDESGLGVEINYQRDSVHLDIGSTPFGFEMKNLVGGISLAPKISNNTELRLIAQRRAVTDSLLSYAGVEDPVTGDRWGAVTRSGFTLGFAFDNEDLGFYGDAGAYYYEGNHVKSNQAMQVNMGAYLRPINKNQRVLQTGVNIGYSSFSENLSKFTYGHGGYFSPQSYVSLAFPLSYSEQYKKLYWRAGGALGFQSYSSDSAAYFPTLANDQRWLDILADTGTILESRYASESKSGFGMNLGLDIRYALSEALTIGTRVSYDTFGDYSETSMAINVLYNTDP
jgi:tetratricopeptide (TPR) repeat protein